MPENREVGELKEKVKYLEKQLLETKNNLEKMLDDKFKTPLDDNFLVIEPNDIST
mgnify:CR=1 FL=1